MATENGNENQNTEYFLRGIEITEKIYIVHGSLLINKTIKNNILEDINDHEKLSV